MRHFLEEFEAFWAAYPRRVGNPKDPARKQWMKLARAGQLPPLSDMITAVKSYRAYIARENIQGEYIAHTRTWLFQKRFEDWLSANQKGLEMPAAPDVPKALSRAVEIKPALVEWLKGCTVNVTDDTITICPKSPFEADYITNHFQAVIESTSRRKVEVMLPQ